MTTPVNPAQVNRAGLGRADYRGQPSTLCQGCGHNSIANQVVNVAYELGIVPENIMKFSGIGCSSKSPAYFLNRSFGFNGLHGRMASLATGALFADTSVHALGVSGDGDTASIGMGGFKHLIRRNAPMTYIVENNGVYGLTKGQFSATAEVGLNLKHQGTNQYMPVDICMEALAASATFVARSFAGDPKQLKELLKAALSHNGIAVLDVISPCVTFNNQENAFHSYSWSKDHSAPLHEISFIPKLAEIRLEEEFEEGTVKEVTMHDGSVILIKKLEKEYDPTSRANAFQMIEEATANNWLVTGLIYINSEKPTLTDLYHLPETALNRLGESDLRPARTTLERINALMF
ncbi:MAG: 2-oxoacid:ferredoxin oxidoreductase subunit beta [Anaerolineales bacterium]|nr:2-oxoacid:ferredoxin oxidoreductase subunit beta [Anaerolineales bacterium]